MNNSLTARKYSCKNTDIEDFEIHYSDYEHKGELYHRALFVLLRGDIHPEVGFYFDSKVDRSHIEITNTVKNIFDKEWAQGTLIKFVPPGSPSTTP